MLVKTLMFNEPYCVTINFNNVLRHDTCWEFFNFYLNVNNTCNSKAYAEIKIKNDHK